MNNTDIENLIRTFVAKTLDDEVPDNKCFIMCYILSVNLDFHYIQHTIKSGMIRPATKKDDIPHYIITFKDNEDKVIDPTSKQIDPTNPQVLIQKMQDPYLKFTEIEFASVYEKWEYRLLHNGFKEQLPVEVLQYLSPEQLKLEKENEKIDIIPYLRILIRAHSVFKEKILELERKGQRFQSSKVNSFFERVNKVVMQNKDKRGKLDNLLLNSKFDKLLT